MYFDFNGWTGGHDVVGFVPVNMNNPVPTTTSLSPTSKTAGDPAFTLTVNGTNFVPASVVNWNGSARTTTYVSATQVTASITAADIATAGTVQVTVVNPTPGGGTSNAQTFTVISALKYDVVIVNGRVMDPLTRFDKVATVGIKDGKIAAITSHPGETSSLRARAAKVIDASGLIVAPGFINVHGHEGVIRDTLAYGVLDGITTMIGGNCGSSPYPLADFFNGLEETGIVANYGTFLGHHALRAAEGLGPYNVATPEKINAMVARVPAEMAAGALGISFGPFYHPMVTYNEMVALATESANLGGGASIHTRFAVPYPLPQPPTGNPRVDLADVKAIDEAIKLARDADTPLLISHMGGPILGKDNAGLALEMIGEGLEEGLRLGADVYTYDYISLSVLHPLFMLPKAELDKVLELTGAVPSDYYPLSNIVIGGQLYMNAFQGFESTDQMLYLRGLVLAGQLAPFTVGGNAIKPQKTWLWMNAPFVMLENDASVASNHDLSRPAMTGNYSNFFGYWVREKGALDMMSALNKTSAMPALFLGLKDKGRLQAGFDADIVLFNPDTIIDTSKLEPGQTLNPPIGIPYVIVNGVVVLEDGELTGAKPGEVIRRTWDIPGYLPGPWNGQDKL
jgi:N-acyl-D-amino-acid deacylase